MSLMILRWDDPRAKNPDLVGPKAANLATLAQAGFPVPAFFVLVPAKDGSLDAILGDLRRRLPRLVSALRESGAQTFAVRSSALAEDRAAGSLAGQLFSATGLKTEDQLLQAFRKCLQSGTTNRVRTALRMDTPLELVHVNVLLQTTVEARWAGVAFTATPRPEFVSTLIEASEASTDAVTAGRAVGERILVTSGRGRVPTAVGLVSGQPVPAPAGEQAPDWLAIHGLAQRARDLLGFEPLAADVEWAWDNNQLWILQARPGRRPPLPAWLTEAPDHVWTSFFFAERFVRPVSPLGWDLLRPAVEKRAFREPLLYLGHRNLAKAQLTRLVNGRPYTRWSVFRKLHEMLSPEFLHAEKRLSFFPDGLPKFSWPARLLKLGRAWLHVVEDPDWLPWANLKRWRLFVSDYVAEVRKLHRDIRAHEHAEALLSDLDRAQQLSLQLLALHRWSLTFAELFLRLLEWELQLGTGLASPKCQQLATELLRGLPGNLTAEMNRALADLARTRDGSRKAKLREFLRKYGHRAPSLDVADPTWRESPELLLRLAFDTGRARAETKHADPHAREKLVTEVFSACRLPTPLCPLWKAALRWTLRLAEQFALLRENQRHYWHLVLEQKRQAVLKIGGILQRRGLLQSPNLVFELRKGELERLATGFGFTRDLENTLRGRQTRRRSLQDRPTFLLWVAREKSAEFEQPGKTARLLRGLGVSQGRARGRVVVLRGEKLPEVPENAVLVLGGLDPGWTPLLGRLAGLVTEVGGALSHGAILAREFGVPAVTGVSGARQILRDGDLVEVDGTAGFVRLLERPQDKGVSDTAPDRS